MRIVGADEKADEPITSRTGAKRNKTNTNIRSRSRRNLQISHSDQEEDSAEPNSRKEVAETKSNVNYLKSPY